MIFFTFPAIPSVLESLRFEEQHQDKFTIQIGEKTYMCGIFGIVTKEPKNLGLTLIEAGHKLSYRGYDTVGAATIPQEGEIDLRKDVGKVEEVAARYDFADMVGAHNGNVVNNVELRRQFMEEGMRVRSENDGESCVHAVERYINQGYGMLEAIQQAYKDLEGDYSFVMGRVGGDCLYALKKGSGMVVGIAEDATCLSSDLPSVLPITRNILRIYDGEMVTLWADRVEIHSVVDGTLIEREPENVEDTMEAVEKGGYDHFMLKEIHEQPKVAADLLHLLDGSQDVERMVSRMSAARNLYLVGCGTSYHACLLGSVYLSRLAGRVTIPVLAPQFIAQYGPALGPEDVGIFVSQSGETKDVLNAVQAAQEKGAGILGLVNVIGSTLTLVSETWLPLTCGYEISVPATKTFTNQVVAFLYLAMVMGGQDTSKLDQIPKLMETTLESTEEQVRVITELVNPWDDLYILGYGFTYPIALEAALKLKEITYAHCEGMLSTEFKHGPLSAVTEGYPVIFIAGPGDVPLIVSGINEVTCRGGRGIAVGLDDPRLDFNAHNLITLPDMEPEVFALMSVLPLQVLSYQMSLARGYDPDFPRNLSKTLTVD
jgi:glucosamine--fructose-6-phosphate aminotransferase (isomerizing)